MPRIPLPGPNDLTPEQRRVHDQVVSGPRGVLIGPLRAAIHSPELAERWSALGEFLRYRTVLPKRRAATRARSRSASPWNDRCPPPMSTQRCCARNSNTSPRWASAIS